MDKATARMNERDGGLAKHAASCQQVIDWENAKIVAKEENWTQRKLLEGIETLRLKEKGIIPLNQSWPTLDTAIYVTKEAEK